MEYDVRETEETKLVVSDRELYDKTIEFQKYLQSKGIAWHNNIANECTNDFGCCNKYGNYTHRFPKLKKD